MVLSTFFDNSSVSSLKAFSKASLTLLGITSHALIKASLTELVISFTSISLIFVLYIFFDTLGKSLKYVNFLLKLSESPDV